MLPARPLPQVHRAMITRCLTSRMIQKPRPSSTKHRLGHQRRMNLWPFPQRVVNFSEDLVSSLFRMPLLCLKLVGMSRIHKLLGLSKWHLTTNSLWRWTSHRQRNKVLSSLRRSLSTQTLTRATEHQDAVHNLPTNEERSNATQYQEPPVSVPLPMSDQPATSLTLAEARLKFKLEPNMTLSQDPDGKLVIQELDSPVTRREKAMRKRHARSRSEERRVGKECRSRWSPYH